MYHVKGDDLDFYGKYFGLYFEDGMRVFDYKFVDAAGKTYQVPRSFKIV